MSHQIRTLKVSKIQEETSRSKSFEFEIPQSLKEEMEYLAGQYLTVIFDIAGNEERRSYSMSSAPSEGNLRVSVKQVEGGLISNHICENLAVGDEVKVMAPEGRFTYEPNPEKQCQHYFFASGSGITPIISHIKEILEQEPLSTLYLLYGNSDSNDVMFESELDNLGERYAGQLFIEYCYSKKAKKGLMSGLFKRSGNNDFKGRIDKKNIQKFLSVYPVKKADKHAFICGPGNMNEVIPPILKSMDWLSAQIKKESFGLSTTSESPIEVAGLSTVEVELDGQHIELSMDASQTILEKLIQEGYDPPYSCTSGACSSCMAKLNTGSVSMDVSHALDDDDIKEGYILTCQSRPTSEKISLKYE